MIFAMLQILQHSYNDIGVVHPDALNLVSAPTIGSRKTMIPIHVHGNHWVMAIADANIDSVTIFDSMPNPGHRHQAEEHIQKLVDRFWPQHRGRIHIVHTSPIIQGAGDTYDCGAYALIAAYAEGSGHSTPAEVDAALMRKVAILLLGPNEESFTFPDEWLQREAVPIQLPAEAFLKDVPQILCKIYEDSCSELRRQRRDVNKTRFIFEVIDKMASLEGNTTRLGLEVKSRLFRARDFLASREEWLTVEQAKLEECFAQIKFPAKQ
ncbi:hypothetical protein NQ176_g6840 [Zarea fungicola]|uniref:Uncharacterized protein n=1 Tax=Zarea fungicola TaxID=93591 RepID=A0ACC1N3I2_9HYPO|nr:hypothetical protein NQ176_g6840 [Lecanicillium fungicola]